MCGRSRVLFNSGTHTKLRQSISNDAAIDKLRMEKYNSPVLKSFIIQSVPSGSYSAKDRRCKQDGIIASFIY
jgi:hypothetical protein